MAHLRLQRDPESNLTSIDLAMMQRAIALADEAAALGEVPVGAVVYRGDEIIAEAANNREATRDPIGHAELLAISKAGRRLGDWRLSNCSLAVTLEPCPMCAGAMINARLDRVIYGADDPKAGACRSLFRLLSDKRLNHRVTVVSGVMGEKCKKQLQDFFRLRRQQQQQSRTSKSA